MECTHRSFHSKRRLTENDKYLQPPDPTPSALQEVGFFGLETQNVEFFWLAASFSLVLFLVGSWYYRGTIRTTYDYVV
jgi:hypothetical protein